MTVNVESQFDRDLLNRAIDHLEKAVDGSPDNVRYRLTLGEAYLAARRFEVALNHLLVVFDSQPDPRVGYLLALAYYRLGNLDAAQSYVEKIRDPQSVGFSRLHLLAGRVHHDRGQFAEAVNEFGQALILKPEAAEPQWHIARSLIAHAESLQEDTTNLYRRALKLLSIYEPRADQVDERHYLLGRAYLALRYPVEALRHLEQTRHPEPAAKALLLGVAMLLGGDPAAAQPFLKEAASNREMRPRLAQYLAEISVAPPDVLRSMASGGRTQEVVVDRTLLEDVFGADAPEVQRVVDAATEWSLVDQGKTRSEDVDRPVGGRLFAAVVSESIRVTAKTPIMNAAAEGPVMGAAGSEDAGRLHPQTRLDVSSSEATTEFNPLPEDEDEEIPRYEPPTESTGTATPTGEIATQGDADAPTVQSDGVPKTRRMPVEEQDGEDLGGKAL